MSGSARVTSIDALRDFKAAMHLFEIDSRNALVMLQMELRRAADWIEHDRPRYWPEQVRRGFDAVSEARIALERCEMRSDDGSRSSCYNEKKALDRAKRRLRLAQEKVEVVRRWRAALRKEAEEFSAQLAKMDFYLESDWQRAVSALQRMIAALDKYAETRAAPAAGTGDGRSTAESQSLDTNSSSPEQPQDENL